MNYEIIGDKTPAAIVKLGSGEGIFCEKGAMCWMDSTLEMKTEGGGLGKMLGRAFSGEAMFRNHYVANAPGEIAFASTFPGEIRAIQVSPGNNVIAQKGSFLACDESVDMSVHFQKKLSSGLFGGEGFIMQKFSGNGTVLIEIDGGAVEYTLGPGEKKIIDTGYLVMMDETCSMEIVSVKGIKNMVLGGEGLFNTVITGPGKIVLQTIPINKMAERIMGFMPAK